MKNTTFRKKALLSSVAMLLVALVALGSATFAWFSANPNADATGISAKTHAAAGLVIRTETDRTWSHHAALYANQGEDVKDLQPVSQEQGNGKAANFFTAEAALDTAFGAKDGTVAPASTSNFYAEKVYFRLSGTEDNTNAKVNLTNVSINAPENVSPALLNCIRVSVANMDNTVIGTYAVSTSGENGVLTTAGASAFNPTIEAQGIKTLDCGFTGLSTADADTKYVTVYVWLDGQDTDCYTNKVSEQDTLKIIENVKVDFALVA